MRKIFPLAILLGTSIATSASAAFLNGQQVRLGHDSNAQYVPQTPTIGPGIEFQNQYFKVDIDDSSLTVTFLQSVLYNPSAQGFNGFRLEDNFAGTLPDFASASILSDTTLVGFTTDQILVTPDLLKLNFASMTPASGAVLKIGVSPIPEPQTLALLASGLTLVITWVRDRQKSAA